ncbi:ATP-binding protein [Pararhodospirillum photometricum]|uniref:histidine kinase n=1 Tax=Pararhodospirillum photometricum DSM 122 TaxID=1150469 RepID=H6SL44_PARPM|nr:ATP-binding protein [Pararhodospirillum photometricum]CCG08709.1 Sensor protein [Pararhodospirillum photometricum DSM 122]
MSRPPPSLRRRLLTSGAAWLLTAVAGAYALLDWAIADTLERTFQGRLALDLESLIAATEVTTAGQIRLTREPPNPLFARPYSGWYWQISHGEAVQRSRSLWDTVLPTQLPPESGALHTHTEAGPEGQRIQVVERDIFLPDLPGPVHVLIAAERDSLEAEVRRLRVLLGGCLVVLAGGVLVGTVVQVRFGLSPVRKVGRDLERLRQAPDARLDSEQPGELAPLVRALNSVLDHDADLIARARAHVGNLAHGLKTPLAVLRAATEEGESVPAEVVRSEIATMHRLVERHLTRARAVTGSGSARGLQVSVLESARRLKATVLALHRRDLQVEVEGDEAARFVGDPDDLLEILGNLLDNACKWARAHVRVQGRVTASGLEIVVEDDGPGLPETEHEGVLRRGARLDDTKPGHGLGLDIVSDLVALYGGHLTLARSELGGLAVLVRF